MIVGKVVVLLRRNWHLLSASVAASLLGAAVMTWSTVPIFEAHTQTFVSLHDTGSASAAYQGGQFSMQRVKSYAQLVTSPLVTGPVIQKLGLDLTPDQLAAKITASASVDTVLIDITVQDPSAERAQRIASAVGATFATVVSRLETSDSTSASPVTVTIVRPPALPTAPVAPRKAVNLTLGLLLGLAFGVGVALLRDSLDTSVKNDTDLSDLTGNAVLGIVGLDRGTRASPLVPLEGSRSPRVEQYRSLRTNLRFVDIDTPPAVVVVTSSVSLEGKSVTACNLAITLAGAGSRTVLVEGDLRRPRIADYMGLEGSVGLTDVLLGQVDLGDALQSWGNTELPLQVLASGVLPPNPSELLGSSNMGRLLSALRDQADFVIVDAPPLLAVTDAAVLTKSADGALLVVRHGKTPREQIRRALDALRNVDAKLLGTVLNMVPSSGRGGLRSGAHGYGYGYGYGYHAVDTDGDGTKIRKGKAGIDSGATAPEPRAAESADQSV